MIRKRDIFGIIFAWSLLAFVGYNVLTVEATTDFKKSTEKEDKKVCEDYGGEWKSIGGGDRGCEIENEQAQGLYGIRPGYSHDGTYADTEYGRLDLGMSDEKAEAIEYETCKNNDLDIKVCKSIEREEEKAAKEDAICDNEDADFTNIEICMSEEKKEYEKYVAEQKEKDAEERTKLTNSKEFAKYVKSKGIDIDDDYHWLSADEQNNMLMDYRLEQRDKITENLCDKVGGKNTKDGCDTGGGDTPKADRLHDLMDKTPGATVKDWIDDDNNEQEPEVIEDWSNTVSETDDKEEAVKEVIKQIEGSEPMNNYPITQVPVEEEKIEDWGNTVSVSETDEQEQIDAAANYQQYKHELLADSSTNPNEVVEQILQEEQQEEEIADNNEESDNQVNTDTEDSSDNTDSSDSQDSSDSEDNPSDDGGDSSDSGDDSSSSDDGGDSGDSSESEE